QQYIGSLREGTGNEYALFLPTAQATDGTVDIAQHTDLIERAMNGLPIGATGPAEPANFPRAAHHHDIANSGRKAPIDQILLRHIGDVAMRHAAIAAIFGNLAGGERDHTRDGLEHRAFTRAVGAD